MSDHAATAGPTPLRRVTDIARQVIRTGVQDSPVTKKLLRRVELGASLAGQSAARLVPQLIGARPRRITIAVTAHCNLRCIGCRYGRDFMAGEQLTLREVTDMLHDARAAGIELVRLYGGEPLLHRDLPAMVRHSVDRGLSTYVTTNGTLLKQKIDALFDAGLRNITIGFYGTGDSYDTYVQRRDRYARLIESLDYLRSRYPSEITLQLNYLISRRSHSLEALRAGWNLARRYDMTFHTDLVHYSLPYFTDGTEGDMQFQGSDRPALVAFVQALAELKRTHPSRVRDSLESIHSIPDWLLKGPDMRVPCDARKLIWVGANGDVQLCYVTFPLGNIRERRLGQMLFTDEHHKAARDAFRLNCPNCHCERDSRILKDLPSRLRYATAPKAG